MDILCESMENSYLDQSYKNIEHIVIDGGSTDGTLEIIKEYEDKISTWMSEPDNGIYDALNKGVELATGEVVGFLHADDIYSSDRVIEHVVAQMTQKNVDSCYGDLLYVDKNNTDKIIRYWKSQAYEDSLMKNGWMP